MLEQSCGVGAAGEAPRGPRVFLCTAAQPSLWVPLGDVTEFTPDSGLYRNTVRKVSVGIGRRAGPRGL